MPSAAAEPLSSATLTAVLQLLLPQTWSAHPSPAASASHRRQSQAWAMQPAPAPALPRQAPAVWREFSARPAAANPLQGEVCLSSPHDGSASQSLSSSSRPPSPVSPSTHISHKAKGTYAQICPPHQHRRRRRSCCRWGTTRVPMPPTAKLWMSCWLPSAAMARRRSATAGCWGACRPLSSTSSPCFLPAQVGKWGRGGRGIRLHLSITTNKR